MPSMTSTTDHGTAYSDYDSEILHSDVNVNPGDNVDVVVQHEPFRRRGGLDNDEIAELVHLRLTVSYGEDSSSSSTTFDGETRGVFGGNLDVNDIVAGNNDGQNNRYKQVDAEVFGGTTETVNVYDVDEMGILSTWDLHASTGGPALHEHMIDFRNMFGRGPVFDASDELTLACRAINSDGSTASTELAVRAHMYWDTATVDGVRTSFSIPERLE